ncbi:hypothetical protein PTW35_23740 (plasmid) [Photobacterium sp. DA100]|uniref:hypothetical protein n=1 Tax=Photobacterium sp. DA100 TaxID=3027472 RepID=UPI002478C908|nr:hypothetical protein [Photobacterium sp. DA100]WEM44301.1 hypothetical protein PTW35_23740 [Photobacterium sp. DA100]
MKKISLYTVLLFLATILAPTVIAQTLDEAIAANDISVSITRVNQEGSIIPFEPVVFELEIESAIKLSKDTSIVYQTFDNAVTIEPPPIKLKHKDAQTFTYQQTLTVYPLKAGKLALPSSTVKLIAKETENTQEDKTTIQTKSFTIDVVKQQELAADDFYVVTEHMEVKDNFSSELVKEFQVGDAIERSIYIIAQDAPTMLMPTIEINAIPGIEILQTSPKVEEIYRPRERVNQTHKEVVITYMLDNDGTYTLPELSFVWWDTSTNKRQVIELKERTIQVGEVVNTLNQDEVGGNVFVSIKNDWATLLTIFAALCLAFIVVVIYVKNHKRWVTRYRNSIHVKVRYRKQSYLKQINEKNYKSAINDLLALSHLLGVYNVRQAISSNREGKELLDELVEIAYSENNEKQFTTNQADTLFRIVSSLNMGNHSKVSKDFTIELNDVIE